MKRLLFKMPDLGEGTVEVEISAWHVSPGDTVSEGQTLADVMTEKAAVELPSPASGRVVEIKAAPGDRVAVGAVIIELALSEAEGAPASVMA